MGNNLNQSVLPQGVRPPVEVPREEPPASPAGASARDMEGKSKWPVTGDDLVGTWINIDPNATGIVKIIVSRRVVGRQDKLFVHPYLGNLDNAHDLGSHAAIAYGDEVSVKRPRAFIATFSEFMSETMLAGHIEYWPPMGHVRMERLAVETYTQGVRHPNYFSREFFRRA